MVISYNQNLHCKIHCKKTPKTKSQISSSYFNTPNNSHNNMNIELLQKSMLLCIIVNINQNIVESHVLLKKIQNNKLNMRYIKIESMVFYQQVPIVPPTLSQTLCLIISYVFQNSFLLNCPKSHHHDKKTTRIQNEN